MQELRELLKIIKRFRYFILIPVIAGIVGGLVAAYLTPELFQASSTIYVYRTQESNSDKFYTYEGYYSQQASIAYTDVVIGLLKTEDLARLALEKAHLDSTNPQSLLKSLNVKKVAPQLINIVVRKPSADEARELLVSLAAATSERTRDLNQEPNRGVIVRLVNNEPLIEKTSHPYLLYTAIGLLAGLAIGFGSVFTITYLKRP